MRRLTWLMLFVVVVALPGCFTLNARHNRNHLKAVSNDMVRLHSDFDRHVLHYDWNDPHDY
jgi:hypothetical protein